MPHFEAEADNANALLTKLLTGTTSTDEDSSEELIVGLWVVGSKLYRERLCEKIIGIIEPAEVRASEVDSIRNTLRRADSEDMFRAGLAKIFSIANQDLHHREVLKKVLLQSTPSDEADILEAMRTASIRNVTGRMGALTHEASETLSPGRVQAARLLHGRSFVYRLLARISLDPGVHPMLSAMALARIGESEDAGDLEALTLEDDAPRGFFTNRVGGALPSVTVFLCNSAQQSTKGSELGHVYLLEVIHLTMDTDSDGDIEELFVDTVRSHSTGCTALRTYLSFLNGEIPFEAVEAKLGR